MQVQTLYLQLDNLEGFYSFILEDGKIIVEAIHFQAGNYKDMTLDEILNDRSNWYYD